MNEGALRAVKIAAIVMAVLIVLGTTTLFVMMARRGIAPSTADRATAETAAMAAQVAAILEEPAGTHIAGITAVAGRLAIQLTGGGADRVLLLDPLSGLVVGRIALAR